MKSAFKNPCRDSFCLWGVALSLSFLVLGAISLVFSWAKLPPQIPLFYSRPWGEEQLAPKYQIIFLPAIALFIFLFNFFSSTQLFPKETLLSRILIGIGTTLVFTFIFALFEIINLIT